MKILLKHKRGLFVTILLFMALVIYVTIGSKGDEKSKYGYTIYQSSYAYTHIGKYDINICTPLKHLRYFPDTLDKYFASEIKKNDINFLTLADDYSIITAYSFPEEIKEINEESISKRLEDSLGSYELASEPKWEMVTLAGNEYLKLNISVNFEFEISFNITGSKG